MIEWIIDLNYPIALIFDEDGMEVSSVSIVSEYIGFIGISIL
jgi:hypothetical protein